ncbi:hypothetical protein GAR06_05564 [Micromonospora saelicesensis]|uniref:hypothetical protein n=1 Tax=Micromonospora saelicesensis TaxID=285676 RepID=UPI000DC421BB|nr:hypothetical protein [Micromonospora saelicesensis]RAO41469.1 hypothetical protein GAR06_05564 [Micromonospora saelicesensis]
MNPFRRADHADTERLLDSAPARVDATLDQGPSATPTEVDANSPEAHLNTPDVPPVAALLAAAAGPVRPGELAGEDAAVAAFRAARANPTPAVPQRPRRRRMTTGAVAWIGAVAATATAGAAFAAVTRDRGPDPVAPAPSRPSPSPHQGASRSTEPGRSVGPGAASPGAPPSVTATPPAGPATAGQMHGQCRAWRAKEPDQREKALRTPAFQKLVTAAGGPAEVEAYCQRLVPETKPSEPAKVTPSDSAKGKPSPSGKAPPSPPRPGHPVGG